MLFWACLCFYWTETATNCWPARTQTGDQRLRRFHPHCAVIGHHQINQQPCHFSLMISPRIWNLLPLFASKTCKGSPAVYFHNLFSFWLLMLYFLNQEDGSASHFWTDVHCDHFEMSHRLTFKEESVVKKENWGTACSWQICLARFLVFSETSEHKVSDELQQRYSCCDITVWLWPFCNYPCWHIFLP